MVPCRYIFHLKIILNGWLLIIETAPVTTLFHHWQPKKVNLKCREHRKSRILLYTVVYGSLCQFFVFQYSPKIMHAQELLFSCWSHSWWEFSFTNKSFGRFYHWRWKILVTCKQLVNRECLKITLQLETEIRPLATTVKQQYIFVAWVRFVFFFGDMEEILLFTIIITMCPGIPDPRCGSAWNPAWNELVWNGFFCPECPLWQRLKKQHIYWEV